MSVNHIYKVVWSKTKGCYIVVSELAKRVGRNKAKAIVISSAAMAMAVSPVMTSTVSATINQAGTGGNESVAFGEQSTAGGSGAMALGKTATASASGAVALGQETKAEKNNGVAIGKGAQSTEDSAIALGFGSKSTGNWSVAIGLQTKASSKQAVAVGSKSQATGENSIAIGNAANASNESSVALGSGTTSTNKYTTAVGGTAFATQEGATALGYEARATATNTIAIGKSAKAEQEGVLALGSASVAQGKDTIAIGSSAAAKKEGDIIIGKEAKSRDQGGGRSVAIGFKAIAGSNRNGHEKDDASTGRRGDDGSVAIGTNAYTGLNKDNTAVNNSVAVGAGAGVGYRSVGADGTPLGVGTDADDNTTVLVKAFGGTTSKLDYFKKTGKAQSEGFFSFQGVDINEGTALGRNTRAIGDQSVAIGAQSVAGMGSIVIGGNDIQAYDQKKYFKAKNPDSGEAKGVNDYNAEVTPGTGKNGQPITIADKYKELVGVGLDRAWRASYGQDGSTVIGMQAHSTTPLGVAIGTNSIVRKGAFGATAIGSGASVVANAEAAVAIGMGSEARGNYAVAAGTAARAKESAVAFGYSSQADVNAVAVGNKSVSKGSAVAVGDESQAVEASVAVGQLAKAKKVADIAVGQGAVASGEQGAIAMGLGTQAQGDSSIMIGGSEITKVAAQTVNYQKEKKDAQGHTIIKSTKKTETIGGEQIERTIRSVEMENTSGTIQQAYGELTNGGTLNTTTLDYSSTTNKNGHGSISMGVHSLSTGDLGTAIGTGARVTKLGGVALGTGAISELQNGVAIGTGSRADMNSIGTRQTDISYDNEGKIVPFDSKKVAYTFYWAGGTNTSEGDVVSFGSPGAERQLKNVAAGRIADDSTDAINGSQLNSITKRMSNGWSVEAEKDKTSSGVLKLNGALATKGTEVHSADGKTTTRENPGTATGNIDKIRLSDEVKIRVGDNLVLHQEDASRPVYEDPDNPDRQTGTRVTSKFTYSLNPELTGLKSAQFKNDAGDTTDINGVGVTVTPVTAGKQPVSLTTTGLNNGGNVISDVAGNLPSTKNNDATTGSSNATTSQAAPMLGNAANQVNPTNAATVSDVLNAGWNLQGNNKAVDFVKPYDTVNFVNGDGTTATVESADGKTSTVKYSVNLGNGLKKDDATNKITVSAADKSLTVGTDGVKVNPGDKSLKTTNAGLTVNTADKSLEVTNDGLKVKTDGTTITTDKTNGLTVNTGTINNVATGDKAGTVEVKDGDKGKIATVDSVVNAVNSAAWIATSAKTTAGELGAEAKNQSVKAGDKVTFEADKNIKITQAGSKFTFATRDDVSFNTVQVGGSEGPKFAKAADSSIKVSDKDGTEPVKITNVKAGEISDTSTDAINGSQFHAVAKNTIKLAGQNGTGTATETDEQELDKKGGIKFTVKSNDGTLLDVAAKGDTITLTPKTATLTTGTDGVPTANTDGGKLVTADQLVTALKEMGWKATAGNEGTGTVTGNTEALIKAGNTVTFKAGDNLAVKQDGKNFIYSLQNELTGLTSAEFKNQAGDKTVINSDGVTITPVNNGKQPVSLTKDGLNNGGNPITNVGSNLDGAKTGTDAPTTKHAPINSTDAAAPNYVNLNNAATVGDVLQAGWNLQGNSTAVDFVKPYDTVNFVNGVNTTAVVSTVDGKTNNVTYNITGLPITYTDKDGNPVSKIGDKFYKVNDKGQPLDAKGNPSTKVNKEGKPVDDAGDVIDPIDTTNNPVKTSLVNPVPKANKTGTTSPTTLDNVTSKLENYKADPVNGKEPAKNSLRDLTNTNVTDNTVATVGDIRNMGWLVSSNKTTGANGAVASDEYSEAVKNANEVRFVGEGSAIVSGKTEGNVRIITVKVDNQAGINTTVTPVNYTKADGTKVYPQEVDNGDGTKTVKFFENPNGTGKEIPSIEVITSMNGPKGTTTPATLSNVKSNLPDTKNSDTANTADAPSNATKSQGVPNITNKDGDKYINPNNAATVSDVLNAGWNLQGNGTEVDFVKAYDTVNFIDGEGTTATVASTDGKTSTVKYSVNLGKGLQKDNTGNTISVKTADSSLVVDDAGVKVNTGTINNVTTGDKPGTVEANNGDENKVATVGNVVNAINNAAWTATSAATSAGELGATAANQLVKSGDKVTFEADKNIKITQDGSKFTFTTKNDVSFDTVQVGGDQGPKLSKTDDGDLKVSGPNGTSPVKVTNVTSGLDTYGDNVPGTTDKNRGLVDLSKPENGQPKVSDNTAATVGDLRNMGWIVSADKKTGDLTNVYSDTVKNANEVKFVGAGTAIVSGDTVDGVRTITVKVDDQTSTNNAVTPVVYTDKDGNQVYPTGKKDKDGNQIFNTKPDGKGADVTGPVKTTINGPKGITSPTSLSNVKNNIPNVNDGSKTITNPDGTEKIADVENINKAPLTAKEAAALANPKTKDGQTNPKYIGNNAATVSDVLNAGWNLQNNGESRDFVKPYDTVNFVNGLGTTAVVTTREGNTASDVTFNVKAANGSVTVDENGVKVTTGEMKPAVGTDNKETGAIATPADPATAKQLKETLAAAEKDLSAAREALKDAEKALAANPKDPALQQAVADKKADVAAKQTPVNEAQKAHDDAGLNKIATVQNVADTINNAGFNLKTSADGGEKLTTGTKNDGELIKPSNTVEMVAGNNLTVKQDANGKITYATKDDVKFTNVDTDTLNVGSPNTYTDGKGNTYTKVGDKYYNPADVVNGAPKQDATPVDVTTPVTPVSPVTMKTEAAKPATNNAADAQPSSALNITAKDGKPTQIIGVGSTLNTNVVTTTPEGTATKPGAAPDTKPKTEDAHLVDLNGTADAPVNKNAAATVGDLQNMGWVVSAKDGNGYKDVVKNANVVDFKGSNGIEITGKTLADGTREITVGIKEGEVTNKVTITHADGKRTRALRVGNHFYKLDKDDRVASINKDEHGNLVGAPLHINPKEDTITNTGSGVVTGNTVANAIQASGWNIGLGSTNKDFSKERKDYDKVNPNDHVKFVDGANANVSMVTVDGVNTDGIKEETTFVKVDVNRDLKIDSVTTGGTAVDKNGNNLVKVGDKYYKESDIDPVTKQLKETAKPVSPADVIPSKDGAMTVKDAKGNDGVSATAKDGKGTLTLKDAGKDGKDASQVDISTAKAPADLNDTPKDAVHANDGKWYAPADVDVKTENGNTVVTPKAGKSPIADAPTMDRIQYKGTDGKLRDVATMDDGLRFQGDDGESISKPLNSTVQLTGGNREDTGKPVAKDATTTGNIGVFNTDGKLSVQLAKDLDKLNSANFESKTDKAGNLLKAVDGKYYPENSVVKEGKVYPEGTVIIDNKPYPAGTTKDAAGKVVNNGKPATEATPINPIDSRQVQNGPTSKLTGTGLTFNTPTPKDEKGKPLVLVDGKYYKADNLENGKPKADAKPEPVKPAQSTAFTPDGLVVTPETAKVRDVNGNPIIDKDGREVVDPTKVVSFGSPTIAVDPRTGKPMVDPKTGEPVMKSGISAGGQVMANVAPGVLDTDAVNVSQLKGVSNAVMNVNNRMNRIGAQAAALAGLQSIQYDPLEPTQISAGVGHYKGSSALALGVNHFKNESTMFHLGASLNGHGDETMMNASVTWKFGARADETAVKDTFRQGPISASYTLQDKVSALEAQTRVQKEQLKTIKGLEKQVELLKELNEKQQEQIAELFKRLSEK